jgi:predicted O-linked N-acetylglucosamine transferase (SPINDLY family)
MTENLYFYEPVHNLLEKNTTVYPPVALKIFHSHVKLAAALHFKLQKALKAKEQVNAALQDGILPSQLVKQYGKILNKPEEAQAKIALIQTVTNSLKEKIQTEITTLTDEYDSCPITLTTSINKYYNPFKWDFNAEVFIYTFKYSLTRTIENYQFKQDNDLLKKEAKKLSFEKQREKLPSAENAAVISEKDLAALMSRLNSLELTNKKLKAKKDTGVKAKRPNPGKAKGKTPQIKDKNKEKQRKNGKGPSGSKTAN